MMKKYLLFITLLLVISFVSLSYVAHGQVAASWFGNVTINGTNASDGVNVLAFNGSTQLAATTVGAYKTGAYLIDTACSSGQNLEIKVYDLSASNVSCTPGNSTSLNLSVNTTSNGVACTFNGSCTSGFCVDAYCCNSACGGASEDCNVAGSEGTCTSTAAAPSGGGGGGGGSGAAPSTKPSETQSITGTVSAGIPAKLSFSKSGDIAVETIEITVKETLQSVSVTVKETNKPSSASVAIESSDGSVYKYLDITPTISNEKISTAKIQFKIPKTWFDDNNIDPNTVKLKKNVGTGWSDLSTTQTRSDDDYYYYEAETSSFSVYAVTGQKKVAAPPEEPEEKKPAITIISPADGAVIEGNTITIRLSVSNFEIVAPREPVADTEGHFHVYLDGGQEQRGPQTTFTYENVSPGEHTIRVELHRSDHTQLDPSVAKTIMVTLREKGITPPIKIPKEWDTITTLGAIIVILIVVLGGAYIYYGRGKKKKAASL